jgi:endonuclease/exonuclease/phosphatase family metal-dependent hydrolase
MRNTSPGVNGAARTTLAGLAFAAACAMAPAAHAATPVRLRILTWNVWGLPVVSPNMEARIAALPDAIAKLDPDVVLLQELWEETAGNRVRQGLERHGYRYSSHLAHTAFGMTGLFTASKLPLENVGFLPFASGRIGHSIWHLEWIASKGVGRFLVQTPLGAIEVQNTHLQAQYDTDLYAAERLSQVGEIVSLHQDWSLPLVLGGDFNTGSEELPRKALLALDALRDTTPSPRPDTIFVRNGSATMVRVIESREALTTPVRLDNGITTELSDHPAVVVDLELSDCTACAPAAVGDTTTREAAHSALVTAAAITPWRVTLALSTAASLLVAAISLFRRTRELRGRSWQFRAFRQTSLAVLMTGFVWTAYLGALYYPARGKALREVARELEVLPPP